MILFRHIMVRGRCDSAERGSSNEGSSDPIPELEKPCFRKTVVWPCQFYCVIWMEKVRSDQFALFRTCKGYAARTLENDANDNHGPL